MLRPGLVVSAKKDMAQWSLFDHVAFLLRFWLVLAVLTVACGVAGFVIRMSPQYESEAIVRIGSMFTLGPLEPINDVVARINSMPFLESVTKKDASMFPNVSSLSLKASVPENSALVKLEATAPTEQQASELLRMTVERLILDHKPLTDHFRQRAVTRLGEIDQQLSKTDELLTSSLGAADRQALLDRTNQLRKERNDLEMFSDAGVFRTTAMLEPPSVRATTPGKRTAVLGAATGLALGIIALYFVEYSRRARRMAAEERPLSPVSAPEPRPVAKV
jgi:hypothetical protein